MNARKEQSAAIVGLGYVGLATAACLASRGIRILGIDVDKSRIASLKQGRSPIHERGLEPLLRSSLKKRTLSLSSGYESVAGSGIIFITVGTPSRDDGSIDTAYVESAAREVGRQLTAARGYRLVVVKSTVVPGTTESLVRPILERESGKKVGKALGLASNPEFLHEGSAIHETLHPEALVIGGVDRRSSGALMKLYEAFYRRLPPTILTTPPNAEMMKYAINAGRATQLSFVNTIANLCTRIPGCDYDEVRKGLSTVAKMDERYLAAGLGFGGSCLPKDGRALAATLKKTGVSEEVVSTAMRVNDGQVGEAIRMAERLSGALEGKRVSVLGLAFKADTDDIRESVSISLVRALIKGGAEVTVYDPAAMENAKKLFGSQVAYAKSAKACVEGSECAFVATGWDQFRRLTPTDFKSLMASPVVLDGRRIYRQDRFLREGIRIATIGTGPVIGQSAEGAGPEQKHKRGWHYTYATSG